MTKNKTLPSEIDQLRNRAETRLQEQLTRPGQSPPTVTETLRLVHELQVNQIELELQNHALLEVRAELEQRAEKYADLYDFAPLGYFTLAANGTIQELNLAGAALLGQDRSHLIGRRFGLFVSAATQLTFNAFLAATLIGTSRQTCEVVLDPAGLPPRFMRLEGIGAVSGTSQQCRIAAIDITERKQAEAALQQSEIFVKDILDSLSAHIAVLDTQGTITLINAAWRQFAEQNGGNVSCQVGANYLEVCRQVLAGDDHAEAQAVLQGIHRIISGTQSCFKLEYPCHSPTEQRWFAMSVFHLNGTRQGIVIRAKTLPRASRRKWCNGRRPICKNSLPRSPPAYRGSFARFVCDRMDRPAFPTPVPSSKKCNGALLRRGVATDAAPLFARIHPDDLGHVNATIAESARDLASWRDEFRFLHPRKGERWFELLHAKVESDGSILWHGFVTDYITERKQTEKALQHSLAEKETLLREVHHRVKNNLAAMLSLLELQRAMQTDVAASSLLNELSGRIKAMSLVHEMLYQSDTLNWIDFHAYLQALIEYLRPILRSA
ncbi:MAG: PAS domain-containing protein [Candidatus Competibacteraceae bacterium]|nr:PAS domain-containing protein [Candidatus Competibacteraceae bacterium]